MVFRDCGTGFPFLVLRLVGSESSLCEPQFEAGDRGGFGHEGELGLPLQYELQVLFLYPGDASFQVDSWLGSVANG